MKFNIFYCTRVSAAAVMVYVFVCADSSCCDPASLPGRGRSASASSPAC